jgi:hypothetical protein
MIERHSRRRVPIFGLCCSRQLEAYLLRKSPQLSAFWPRPGPQRPAALSISLFMAANGRLAKVGYALGVRHKIHLEDRIVNVRAKANRVRKTRAQSSALATSVLLIMTCLGVSGFSLQATQPASTDADLQQFVGTWHAEFKGKTFLTIKLEKQDRKLTGTASHADIRLNKDGELTSAEEQDVSNPIVEAKLTNGTLRITIKDQDSQDTYECKMKRTGTDQAQLQIVIPPDVGGEVPRPKPWKLERAKSGQ